MDLLDFLFICFIFYLGYITGSSVTYFKIHRMFRKFAESLGIDIDQELAKIKNKQERNSTGTVKYIVHALETEVHGDTIYLFDKEKNDFICQAKSIEECAQLAKEFKKINDAVVIHGDKVFVFNDGKIIEKST